MRNSSEDRQFYLQINMTDFASAEAVFVLGPLGVGILLNLAHFAVRADLISTDAVHLARLGRVSEHVFKKHWPQLQQFFVEVEGGLRFLPPDWMTVGAYPMTRRGLTHLLPELVAFWGSACVYCGDADCSLEVEHIVPVVRGGTDEMTNLTVSCRTCNLAKRTRTATEFGHPEIQERATRRLQ
jgi:hypothetical protein